MKRFRKSKGFTLVEIMIVVLIIGILLAIAIPNFMNARESSRARACVANLKQIDSAKQQYMMDNNSSTFTNTDPTSAGLVGKYIRVAPACPGGGTYTTGDQTISPACSLATSGSAEWGSSGPYPHYLP